MTTLKNRVSQLEAQSPQDDDHEWEAVIGWEGENTHYYKDGVEISQGQYFREAPRNQPIEVEWREIIPAWQDPSDPELWHLDRDMADEPITWDEIEKRYPENAKLQITPEAITKIEARR